LCGWIFAVVTGFTGIARNWGNGIDVLAVDVVIDVVVLLCLANSLLKFGGNGELDITAGLEECIAAAAMCLVLAEGADSADGDDKTGSLGILDVTSLTMGGATTSATVDDG
jgi:hypothetical protein